MHEPPLWDQLKLSLGKPKKRLCFANEGGVLIIYLNIIFFLYSTMELLF